MTKKIKESSRAKLAWFVLISNVFLSGFIIFCIMSVHSQIVTMERHLTVECHKE